MSLKLTNNLFLRTMLRGAHLLGPDSKGQPLIPYFQYTIGPYQKGYILYFRREPSWPRYKYEAFDKMNAMSGYDVPRFLDFHYAAYPDKEDFRRFLRYEIEERTAYAKKHPGQRLPDHHIELKWLEEQEKLAATIPSSASANSVDDRVTDTLEEKLTEMQRSFVGKIVIDGQLQLERFIQLLVLVKDLRAPGRSGEMLFSSFSTTDMAAILRQFTELSEYKTNTLQKKIAECTAAMRHDDEADPLREALTRFFFDGSR